MNPIPFKNPRRKNSVVSIAWTLAATFGLLLASPVSSSAQELFVLSTESGLELYQVGNLIEPDLLINTSQYTENFGNLSWYIPAFRQPSTVEYSQWQVGLTGNRLQVGIP